MTWALYGNMAKCCWHKKATRAKANKSNSQGANPANVIWTHTYPAINLHFFSLTRMRQRRRKIWRQEEEFSRPFSLRVSSDDMVMDWCRNNAHEIMCILKQEHIPVKANYLAVFNFHYPTCSVLKYLKHGRFFDFNTNTLIRANRAQGNQILVGGMWWWLSIIHYWAVVVVRDFIKGELWRSPRETMVGPIERNQCKSSRER